MIDFAGDGHLEYSARRRVIVTAACSVLLHLCIAVWVPTRSGAIATSAMSPLEVFLVAHVATTAKRHQAASDGRLSRPPTTPAVASPQPDSRPERSEQPAPGAVSSSADSDRAAPLAPDPVATASYAQALATLIAKHRLYPRLAQLRRMQGEVEVELHIAPGVGVVDMRVRRSSGFELLDRQALEMIRLARPLPEPPELLRAMSFRVLVPVVFRLDS